MSGQVAVAIRFLTRDLSLVWNTAVQGSMRFNTAFINNLANKLCLGLFTILLNLKYKTKININTKRKIIQNIFNLKTVNTNESGTGGKGK